mmetsp:Transcript_18709/g.61423  ORF Transcript_18709/g.61423 Transcript_18709/m.61423 type:complete len:861 (-) Transcript_18709:92-2674(-)
MPKNEEGERNQEEEQKLRESNDRKERAWEERPGERDRQLGNVAKESDHWNLRLDELRKEREAEEQRRREKASKRDLVSQQVGGIKQVDFWQFTGMRQVGSGSFKLVYKARWLQSQRESQVVAILRIRGSGSFGNNEEFEKELQIFQQLGRHPNLLRLLAVTIDPASGDSCLVTEFAPKGSLDIMLSEFAEKQEAVSLLVQLQVAKQICDGMVQLSLHDVVHRDLATRNVLVFSLDVRDHLGVCVKIADYGLSIVASRRQGEGQGASVSTAGTAARPVRWMAPESIRRRQYSEKSDVWAFGVTMWEVWTYGKIPYWAFTDDSLVGPKVLEGDRLSKPETCPWGCYRIMQECWKASKHARPNFIDLQKSLQGQYYDALLSLSIRRQDEGKVIGNPRPQDVLENYFDVSLNPESAGENKTRHDLALALANWMPEAESTRQFNPNDVKAFLDQIDKGPRDVVKIIGFSEFPFTNGRRLKEANWTIEREYWLKLDRIDRRVAGEDGYVILHVHYAGKWTAARDRRDTSMITQLNIRHTTRKVELAYHRKCVDLNKWKERHGSEVLPNLPAEGWRWRENPGICRSMHGLLMEAERCTTWVRSLVIPKALSLATPAGAKKALIISNKKYQHTQIKDLPNAIMDGSKLESALMELGWDVEFEVNLGLEDMVKAVKGFRDSVREDRDAALFAFIGHAVEVNGKLFLIPKGFLADSLTDEDMEEDLQSYALPFSKVQSFLRTARKGRNPTVFVLDCCRSNGLSASVSRSFDVGTDKLSAPGIDVVNSCVVYSTQAGQVAFDGEPGRGGPFMSVFAANILAEDKSLNDVMEETRKSVINKTNMVQMAPFLTMLTEAFFFNPGCRVDVKNFA